MALSGNDVAAFVPRKCRRQWHRLRTEQLLRASDARSAGIGDQGERAHRLCAHRPQRRGGKDRPEDAADSIADLWQSKGGHGADELVSLHRDRLAAQNAGVAGPGWGGLAELTKS